MCEGRKASPERMVKMEHLENAGPWVTRERPALPVLLEKLDPWALRDLPVKMEHLDQRDLLDLKDLQALRDPKATLARQVSAARRVPRALQARLVVMARTAPRVSAARPDLQDQRDRLALKDLGALLAKLDPLELMGLLDQEAQKALLDLLGRRAPLVRMRNCPPVRWETC